MTENMIQNSDFYQICLKNLIAFDNSVVSFEASKNSKKFILNAENHVKKFFTEIFKLKNEITDEGKVWVLPSKPAIILPRQYKTPEGSKQTKWSKFAQEKNILKKKKSRLIFDEASKQWIPRWGSKDAYSQKKQSDEAIYELKPNEDLKTAIQNRTDKSKLAKAKHALNTLRNSIQGKPDPSVAGIEIKDKKSKAMIEYLKNKVGVATASFGTQDKTLSPRIAKKRHTKTQRIID